MHIWQPGRCTHGGISGVHVDQQHTDGERGTYKRCTGRHIYPGWYLPGCTRRHIPPREASQDPREGEYTPERPPRTLRRKVYTTLRGLPGPEEEEVIHTERSPRTLGYTGRHTGGIPLPRVYREAYRRDMAHSSLPGGYNRENMTQSSLPGCIKLINVSILASLGVKLINNSVYYSLPAPRG